MAANKQRVLVQTILAGVATFAMLALFHTPRYDAKTVGGSALTRVVADGNDDEAQLQQQLQAQQQMQQAEQQEQLDLQQAQQDEQQGLQVEQQATLSVPGS